MAAAAAAALMVGDTTGTLASRCTSRGRRCWCTASSASRGAPGHPQSQAGSGFTLRPRSRIPTPSKPWRISTGRFMPSTGSLTSSSPTTTPSHAYLAASKWSDVSGLKSLFAGKMCLSLLEGLTDFCWLCENPQKLVVPFEMRGYQGVYNLERRIYDGAVRGLTPVQGPLPIKFPLPDPRDRFSLKPGSLAFDASKSEVQKSTSVTAAIAGARAAATQFSKRDPNAATSSETRVREQSWGNHADSNSDHQNLPSVQRSPCLQNQNQPEVQKSSSVTAAIAGARAAATQFSNRDPNAAMSSETHVREQSWANHADSNSDHHNLPSVPGSPAYLQNQNQPSIFQGTSAYSQNPDTEPRRSPRLEYGASNRLVAVALRELKQLSVSERGQPVGRS